MGIIMLTIFSHLSSLHTLPIHIEHARPRLLYRERIRTPVMSTAKFIQPLGGEADSSKKPILLFLPGIDGTGLAGVAGQWPRLSPLFDIWSMRLEPEDRSSFDSLADLIITFIGQSAESSDVERRRVLIVGESTGAVLALNVALRAAQLVDALALINPATNFGVPATPFSGPPTLDRLLPAVAPLLPLLPRPVYEAAAPLVTPLFGKPGWFSTLGGAQELPRSLPSPAEALATSRTLATVLPPGALEWRLRSLLSVGVRSTNERLAATAGQPPRWAASCLLLAGAEDRLLPSPAETRRLQQALPGAIRKARTLARDPYHRDPVPGTPMPGTQYRDSPFLGSHPASPNA